MTLFSYNTFKEGVLFTLLFLTSIATMAQSKIKSTVKQNGNAIEEALLTTDASDGLVCSFASDGTLIMTKGTDATHIAELPMKHGAAMDIEFSNTASASIPNSQDNKRKVGFTVQGYATIYSAFQITIPSGVKVYAPTLSGNELVLSDETQITGTIPAATGVIVKRTDTPGNFTYKVTTPLSSITSALKGSVISVPFSEDYSGQTIYTLADENSKTAFYKYNPTSTPVCRAFLPMSSEVHAKSITFKFDDDPTGISDIEVESNTADGKCYNLSGQRVNSNTKGIVIIDGKKYINR